MTVPLSVEDVLALEAIADLDEDVNDLGEDEQVDGATILSSDDNEFFDAELGDEELLEISFDFQDTPDILREVQLDEEAQAQGVSLTKFGTRAEGAGSFSSLKRPRSAEEPRGSADETKPAKLNKSFSDGLDEAFSRVSLDTVPDDEPSHQPPRPQARSQSTYDDDVEAQLAIEDEINATLAAQAARERHPLIPLPNFTIPPDVLRAAIASNAKGTPCYWSHDLYQGPSGQRVQVYYCKTIEESEPIARLFLNEPIVGFDMEWVWRGAGLKSLSGLKRAVSLIQMACEDKIALFHVAVHRGTSVNDLICPSLRRIVETPTILKTGVNILTADASRLKQYFGLEPRGLIELSHLFQVVTYRSLEYINNKLRAMAKQVEQVLKLPLLKDDVRTSDWSKELNSKQILYAADDAYAGYMLYRIMEAQRSRMRPPRKRPELAELRIPMREQYHPDFEDTTSGASTTRARDCTADVAEPAAAKSAPQFDDERDARLYQALCYHRTTVLSSNIASHAGKTLSDSVLRNIAVARPTDLDALSRVKGVGVVRITAYGDVWLRIVDEHSHLWAPSKAMTAPASGFRKPPDLPRALQCEPKSVSAAVHQQPTQDSLFIALQKLRSELIDDARLKGFDLPGDETLFILARKRPADRRALAGIPDAMDMSHATSTCGTDLLEYIQQHIRAHETQSGRNAAPLRCEQDGSDDDGAFEVMNHRRVSSPRRWVV